MAFVSIQSTEGVEERRTFDYWRSTALAAVDADAVEPAQPFKAGRLLAVSAHGTLMHTRSSPVVIARQSRHIRRDGLDHVAFSLLVSGRGHHEQGRRGAVIGTGEMAFLALDRPFVAGIREPYEELRLHIPRAAFQAHVGNVEAMAGRSLGDGGRLGALFTRYLADFAGSIARMTETETAQGFEGTLHLLGTIARGEDKGRPQPSASALRSLARAYIERRMHDPALDPAEICASLHVSRSRLYAAFAEQDGIAATIRDTRLDRAHRRLSSAASDGETIAVVLSACGFTDSAHFSRAFRRRFGVSPRDVREMRHI